METKRLEVTAEGKKVYDIVIENNFNQLVKELSVFGIKERKLCIVTERQVASAKLKMYTSNFAHSFRERVCEVRSVHFSGRRGK